jgi:hypothetical protein
MVAGAGVSHDRLLYRILEAARVVHTTLGPGFVESIYGRALGAELKAGGFSGRSREGDQDLVWARSLWGNIAWIWSSMNRSLLS